MSLNQSAKMSEVNLIENYSQGSQIDWAQHGSFKALIATLLHEPQRSFAGTVSTGIDLEKVS